MDECVEEHADGNIHDIPDMAKQIIGAAAVNLLKQGRRATPQALYTLVLLWEKQARNSQDRAACRQALRLLSRKPSIRNFRSHHWPPSTRAGVMMKEEHGMNHDYDRNEALAGELVGQAVIALLDRGENISFAALLHELAAMRSQTSNEAVRNALDTASADVRARMNEGNQESDAGEHYFQTRDSSEDDALH